MKKLFAFTLAETLIVMGVIGVVAALTLPNLNQSTGDKEKVVKLQKVYSNIQDAFNRAEVVYGPFGTWFVNDGNDNDKKSKRMFERITEFMKYSKVCTVSDACTLFYTGADSGGTRAKHSVILPDGATLGFNYNANGCPRIYIDIDGVNKGPNVSCKDYFQIHFEDDTNDFRYVSPEHLGISDMTRNKFSAACTTWVLQNGNMDYLKCPNDLSWTKTTCK